ncbi:hypothetical protein G6F37_002882 [Rhizopus arrhizus]|nr:hypothetical protein G6F38_003158 [Rhizopus arrhizus]KAG1161649.1 hypothetical protein G6F37_002882 [Rhizopus arrhizus]
MMVDEQLQYNEETTTDRLNELASSSMENTKEWDARMELALFNAISRCKPVGIHKHFRIISIQKQFNQNSPVPCSIGEIWSKLNEFYGMEALNELAEEDDEQEGENEDLKGEPLHEFSLPLEDYEQLISEHRQDDHSGREESPMSPSLPPTKRTRIGKREMSPTNSAGDSVTSTPEPEEGKSSRRRGTKRSEATPEPPSGRHSAGSSSSRRAGRSSSATRGAGAKRQASKRK